MLSANLFGGTVEVPATTQQAIEALRSSIEASVQAGTPRMDIELPAGLRLGGVEGVMDPLAIPRTELPPERIARADRDLARYMGILYKAVGEKLYVAFRTAGLAKAARPVWESAGTGGRIGAFSRKSGSRKSAAFGGSSDEDSIGFRRSVIDSGCSHLVMVAPRVAQLKAIAQLDQEVGSDVCIILLNARLRGRAAQRDALREELALFFNPVFHLRLVGRPGSEGIVYRCARDGGGGTPWVLAKRVLEASNDGEAFVSKEVSRTTGEPLEEDILASLA